MQTQDVFPLSTHIRRLALVWWVRNLRHNPERADRWKSLADRYA